MSATSKGVSSCGHPCSPISCAMALVPGDVLDLEQQPEQFLDVWAGSLGNNGLPALQTEGRSHLSSVGKE